MQNGYGGRSRNLVDDAKFESRVHDEEKQNIIDTVKRQSSIQINGELFLGGMYEGRSTKTVRRSVPHMKAETKNFSSHFLVNEM